MTSTASALLEGRSIDSGPAHVDYRTKTLRDARCAYFVYDLTWTVQSAKITHVLVWTTNPIPQARIS